MMNGLKFIYLFIDFIFQMNLYIFLSVREIFQLVLVKNSYFINDLNFPKNKYKKKKLINQWRLNLPNEEFIALNHYQIIHRHPKYGIIAFGNGNNLNVQMFSNLIMIVYVLYMYILHLDKNDHSEVFFDNILYKPICMHISHTSVFLLLHVYF